MDPSNSSDSPKEIYRAIRNTRNRLDSTVDELAALLSPSRLIDSAIAGFKIEDHTLERQKENLIRGLRWTYQTTAKQVQNHPGPALVMGAGVAWMLFDHADKKVKTPSLTGKTDRLRNQTSTFASPRNDYDSDNGEDETEEPLPQRIRHTLSEKAHQLAETTHRFESTALSAKDKLIHKTQDTMDSIKETASSVAESASQWTATAADKTRHASESISNGLKKGYWASEERYEQALESHPLALGAGAFALGLLASLALPHTRREDRMIGERSHAAIAAAKRRGNELIEKGRAVAGEVTHHLQDDAKEAGRSSLKEMAADGKRILAAKASEMVKEGMHSVKDSAKDHNLGNKQPDPNRSPASTH